VQETSSWNLTPGSDRRIFDRGWGYVSACYRLVGLTDIFSDESRYAWGEEARGRRPVSPFAIFVYERAGDAPCTDTGRAGDAPRAGP